jgi:hypothetical protein
LACAANLEDIEMTGLLSGATIFALADRPMASQMRLPQVRSGSGFAGVLAQEMRAPTALHSSEAGDQRGAFAGAVGAMAVEPTAERKGASVRRKLAAYRRIAAIKL